jgi:N-acetylglucosamine kinase-like BadF-type ATPase
MKPEAIKSILATDCGSTTTKAILIEKQGDEYRLVVRGEAPTTVDVQSSSGTNDTIAAADATNAGVMTKAMYDNHVLNNN